MPCLRTARLTSQDAWQYQSGWPSGFGYDEARRFIAQTAEPGSAVAYVINSGHRLAASGLTPLPAGVTSLGLFDPPERLRLEHGGPIYVLVDDGIGDDAVPGARLQEVLRREPRLQLVAHFTRPHAATGVAILRRP